MLQAWTRGITIKPKTSKSAFGEGYCHALAMAQPLARTIADPANSTANDIVCQAFLNRWAADVVRAPPKPLEEIRLAAVQDLLEGADISLEAYGDSEATPIQIQSLLRHALSFTISEAIINCLVITNSMEANIQIARIHEQIFASMFPTSYTVS